MKLDLYASDIEEIVHNSYYNECYNDADTALSEKIFHAKTAFGEYKFHEIFFNGIRIAYGHTNLSCTTVLHYESIAESIEMHFDLSGYSVTQSSCNKFQIEVSRNQHNIIYLPGFRGKSELNQNKYEIFEVNMSPEIFKHFLKSESHFLATFKKNIDDKIPFQLFKHHLFVTAEMLNIINQIIHCNRTGFLQKMFLESKITELLMLQLEQHSKHDCRIFCTLKKTDIDKMHYAKDILLSDEYRNYSLPDLARHVGTNEFTLKKGFKEIFGTTVFGFRNEALMTHALKMLTEEGKTIKEASVAAQYKNPTHFIAAFKKRFGFTPGRLKL